jgi:hypothetical protein
VLGLITYHEAVGEYLDAVVSERSGGELQIAEVAAEDLGGHGGEVVDQVNDDGGDMEVRLLTTKFNTITMLPYVIHSCPKSQFTQWFANFSRSMPSLTTTSQSS